MSIIKLPVHVQDRILRFVRPSSLKQYQQSLPLADLSTRSRYDVSWLRHEKSFASAASASAAVAEARSTGVANEIGEIRRAHLTIAFGRRRRAAMRRQIDAAAAAAAWIHSSFTFNGGIRTLPPRRRRSSSSASHLFLSQESHKQWQCVAAAAAMIETSREAS